MRPNLMSPRRPTTSGEDSILAMLERGPARKRSPGGASVRFAGYGASAALVLALTGVLVWMAANNDGLRPDVQATVLAEAANPPRRNTPAASDSPAGAAAVLQVAIAPAATVLDAQPGSAALIVDGAPPAGAVPPLRLLEPAADKPAAERTTPAVRATSPSVPAAATPRQPLAGISPPPRPTEARPFARPAAAPAKSRPVMVARNAGKPVQPRVQRGVNPARASDPPIDADVALISAVIVHANGHAPEGSQMTELLCPDESCQARPPRQ